MTNIDWLLLGYMTILLIFQLLAFKWLNDKIDSTRIGTAIMIASMTGQEGAGLADKTLNFLKKLKAHTNQEKLQPK